MARDGWTRFEQCRLLSIRLGACLTLQQQIGNMDVRQSRLSDPENVSQNTYYQTRHRPATQLKIEFLCIYPFTGLQTLLYTTLTMLSNISRKSGIDQQGLDRRSLLVIELYFLRSQGEPRDTVKWTNRANLTMNIFHRDLCELFTTTGILSLSPPTGKGIW